MPHHRALRRLALALAAAGLLAASLSIVDRPSGGKTPAAASAAGPTFDPLLDTGPGSIVRPDRRHGDEDPRRLARRRRRQDRDHAVPAATDEGRRRRRAALQGLGTLAFPITTRNGQAQAYFNQGLRLSFAFNHAEAQRAFQTAQKLDPNCAACFWGEALILGPNINVPMMPEANAPALAALEKAVALKARAGAKERALIEALEKRYSADRQGRAPGARRGLRRRDEAGGRALPGRRHDPHALRRERDGHPAVGLLGGRRRHAEGPRRRDRFRPRDRAQAQSRRTPARSTSTSTRSRPRPRPSGRCRMPTAWPR